MTKNSKPELNQLTFNFMFGDQEVSVVAEPEKISPPMAATKVARAVKKVIEKREVFVLGNQLNQLTSTDKKIAANIAALQQLKALKARDGNGHIAAATSAEKDCLAQYTGWGGTAKVFDESHPHHGVLKSLLSATEYESARSSVLTSYFTEPHIIESIWKILRKMGFAGGRVIETSAGVGNFIGAMPMDMRANSEIVMVEPDFVSADILARTYDENGVRIYKLGLEKAPLQPQTFDLAISNVPFGSFKVYDPRFNSMKLVIHDYFFAKALDLVRPGGVVAFITSTGTLDKTSGNLRGYLAGKADLVTAIRLPSGAFSRLGGTEVETDLVVLRKKPLVDDKRLGLRFAHTGRGDMLARYGVNYCPNQVFCENKQLQIGQAEKSTRYGVDGFKIEFKGNLVEALAEVVNDLSVEGWYSPAASKLLDCEIGSTMPEGFVSGYFFDENQMVVYMGPDGKVEPQSHLSSRALERLAGMMRVRDRVVTLIELDSMNRDSAEMRASLNAEYDNFVSVNGPLMSPVNRRLISLDSYAPLLWSLEYFDEDAEVCRKAEIFARSTVSMAVLSETAESIGDAIALSYNKFGKLDIEAMATAMGKDAGQVVDALLHAGLAYVDPEGSGVIDALEYLSGNIRVKLLQANSAAAKNAMYLTNVTALQAVIPPSVPIGEISIRLGAPWLNPEDIENFVSECIFEEADAADHMACKVTHSAVLATWNVDAQGWMSRDARAKAEWGTSRADFFRLLQNGLNQQQPEVRDLVFVDEKERSVVNVEETTAAREKLAKIQDAFAIWIKADATRAKRLEEVYNDLFNSKVNRTYDGSHLVIPGFNPSITLRPAQKDSVWRGIVSGNVLYALAVGGGKTLIQIILAQESKRLGLAKKPVLVVPNHMLEAFASEYMRAFPKARILAATKADMDGDKRRTLMMRIATGNWDAVIITHSSFGKIAVSKDAVDAYAATEIAKIDDALRAVGAGDRKTVREMEAVKKSVELKLEALSDQAERDVAVLSFDQLGIDLIIVDEADLFKNLWFFTKKTRVAGLTRSASMRAFGLFLKSRCVFAKRGSNRSGLVFATATPISNTVAEMFVMQTYLQQDALAEAKVDQFDAWAANFGREVTSIEVAPDGSGYRMHTRFCRFENVPELTRIFREVAEIRTKKMLDLPVPKLAGGGHQIVAVPPSAELKAYVAGLVLRSEEIRRGTVKPEEDNMLVVTSDGRKAALDMRCVNEFLADYAGSKLNACIENVFRLWEEGKGQKLTQLVFSDISTPSSRFSVYRDARDKLIARGVPAGEIAFAQDYDTDRKKSELHRKVRCGRIRILFGSTELMGFGTNVQDLLVAEHHLDAPWRPRDVEQRDGRIERQGNLNEEIWIFRYVTEGSFDAYMWQTLETKAKFIEQVFSDTGGARTIEDVSSQSLSCAEVKALASGNPMVIEKAGIDSEVAKLCSLKASWSNGQRQMRSEHACRIGNIQTLTRAVADCEADIEFSENASKTVKVGPLDLLPSVEVAKEVMRIIETAKLFSAGNQLQQKDVCQVAGMKLGIETQFGACEFGIVGSSGRRYVTRFPYGLENTVQWLSVDVYLVVVNAMKDFKVRLAENQRSVASLTGQMDRPFEYQVRLDNAVKRQLEIDSSLGLISDEAGANALAESEA